MKTMEKETFIFLSYSEMMKKNNIQYVLNRDLNSIESEVNVYGRKPHQGFNYLAYELTRIGYRLKFFSFSDKEVRRCKYGAIRFIFYNNSYYRILGVPDFFGFTATVKIGKKKGEKKT